jgi:hypothetical protein
MQENTLGQVVGLDLLLDCESLDLPDKSIVASDRASQQTLVTEMIESSLGTISLTARPNQGEVRWRLLSELAIFYRSEHSLSNTETSPSGRSYDISISNHGNCVGRGNNLADRHASEPPSGTPTYTDCPCRSGDVLRLSTWIV